ncbi:hypothetical protein BLX87_24580 [Bacillus sp. VT-16-64]|nr:hypothetical protein BLX87_24580 [Bacillus sp. VT-16-64]
MRPAVQHLSTNGASRNETRTGSRPHGAGRGANGSRPRRLSRRAARSGDALYVAQVARFAGDRYVRAILIVRGSEKDKFADRFRRLAKSLTIN